jgi:hypothetical protein
MLTGTLENYASHILCSVALDNLNIGSDRVFREDLSVVSVVFFRLNVFFFSDFVTVLLLVELFDYRQLKI